MLVREARKEDIPQIACIHVNTWMQAYREILPAEFIAEKTLASRIHQWTGIFSRLHGDRFVFVACESNNPFSRILGWADGGFWEGERETAPGIATESPWQGNRRFVQINGIYVSPSEQRKGIGQALLYRACQWGQQHECSGLRLVTLADNPYRHFYEKLHGKRRSETKKANWGGMDKTLVIYEWNKLELI